MMKFIRQKDAAGRMPERGKRKGSLRGIPGLALVLALGVVLAAGGMGTRTYAWNLDPPGIEEDGELVTFPSTSGKENGTETEKGNDWTSGLEGGTTVVILSDGEPTTISAENEKSNMEDLLTGVTIKDKDGKEVPKENGTLYVGEDYKIHLEFTEGGAQGLQFDTKADELYYQIPDNFEVKQQGETPLTVDIDGIPVTIGTYSIDEHGKLIVKLNTKGKEKLHQASNVKVTFDMDATAQSAGGDSDGKVHFGGAGEEFDFRIEDQPRVEVDKEGKYTENKPEEEGKIAAGGKLEYTVTTTVKHGSVSGLTILDELTPPNTTALNVEDVDRDAIKVTLKKLGDDGTTVKEVELQKDVDYELVEVDDAERPGKKTFQVKLKEDSTYTPLNEGDALVVTYPYEVEYVPGSTDVFWGNVANDVHVTGKGKVPPPAEDPEKVMPEINIDEHKGSSVEIMVTPPGDGIIFKTQEFSEKDHKLHYTLYTVVPAGEWTPFYIQDDMVVEFGGEKYYLPEFKEDGRVSNLTVSTVTVNDGALGDWSDKNGEQRRLSLEELKNGAKNLGDGFNFDKFPDNQDGTGLPEGYDPESMDQWVYLYIPSGNRLNIIFGFEGGKYGEYEGKWGHWNITDHDTLIITEYDLDMSDDGDPIILQKMGDSSLTLEKKASEVLLAGIRNNVNMRFSRYYPGYSVFFNNAERMNKTGVPNKNDNTITWTVTMNTTDTTVNKYFRDVTADMWLQVKGDGTEEHLGYGWGTEWYLRTMQAAFYDKLPDGWEYVEGSLSVTTRNTGREAQTFFYPDSPSPLTEDGRAINALLVLFRDDVSGSENKELFNVLSGDLEQMTFTYKLKATDEWIHDHVTDKNAVTVHNHAEIRDKLDTQPHWTADANVDYLPQHLTKEAEQVGEGSNLLKFTLQVNPGNESLYQDGQEPQEYLIVTDISENMVIQTDSIVVSDAEGSLTKDEKNYKLEDLKNLSWPPNQWGMLSPQEEGRFSLIVPNGKALTITYNALIPEAGDNVSVSNRAEIEGIARSNTSYEDSLLVKRIEGSGTGNTYKLKIKKIDSMDGSKKLKGAEFKFYIVKKKEGSSLTSTDSVTVGDKTYDCHTENEWKFTTEDDGTYEITGWNLEPGNYYILQETKAPDGYKLAEPVMFYYGLNEDEIDETEYPNAVFVIQSSTDFLKISDPPVTYELPETGGFGTAYLYLMGSVFVLMGGAFLLYDRRLARKRAGR